jgi:hypothetical protein
MKKYPYFPSGRRVADGHERIRNGAQIVQLLLHCDEIHSIDVFAVAQPVTVNIIKGRQS